jgi:hypothetical protein
MDNIKHRKEIEKNILAAERELWIKLSPFPKSKGDFYEFDEFMEVCEQLTEYYKHTPDTDIGVDIFRMYMDFESYFSKIMKLHSDDDIGVHASICLFSLRSWIDDIIVLVYDNKT